MSFSSVIIKIIIHCMHLPMKLTKYRVTSSAKNYLLISYIQGLFFYFVIVALFILLHDRRISVVWLGVQSFIQFYFLYVRRHALDYSFPKHVYSVVRSPSQCKELLENFRSYYNCRRFGAPLTPRVKIRLFTASAVNSRTSLILINAIESC